MVYNKDVTLVGHHILLRSPRSDDLEGLCDAANDGEIWKNQFTVFPDVDEMSVYLQNLIKHDNTILPFTIVEKKSNRIIGMTRFLHMDGENRRVEIGPTWIAKSFDETATNNEAKFLMLQYAFEKLHCIKVEIRADVFDKVSRKAIESLGAKQDGILRKHEIMKNGRIGNTTCYSIISEEWPDIRENLLTKLGGYKNRLYHLIFYIMIFPIVI
jgi:RimJ/RimL family protein N-acetyltransferase